MKQDERITRLLDLAKEYAGDPRKLRGIEYRLRGVAASQSLGRRFNEDLSVEQWAVVDQAVSAAAYVARMAETQEHLPKKGDDLKEVLRQQGLEMDLAERDRMEDEPYLSM